MPSYWWKCTGCQSEYGFPQVTGQLGIAQYIQEVLVPSDWDQEGLKRTCPACAQQSLQITYKFPRKKDPVDLTLVHAVGLHPDASLYVPMMWETIPHWDISERWFDFKYVIGTNINGLMKPAVFTQVNLSELFKRYKDRTGVKQFP